MTTTSSLNSPDSTKQLSSKKEPIAIIGIGCRFPGGANDPASFWKLLCDKVDAITDVPADRWNVQAFYSSDRNKPGKTYTRQGGFIENIDQFDAHFFGISPREAACIDPQQRLLLEVAWESMEDAGLVPAHLAGTKTAVFVGLWAQDYERLQHSLLNRDLIESHTSAGTSPSIAANRISYVFDLHGPSVTVNTACSSSLVAVHLACQSIWNGESSLALAGGVNALLTPDMTIATSKATMLSPDNRSLTFDERANGYVRSEGAGLVVLKPLSQALADGNPIYAIICGTAVNQDGHTDGITMPSQAAQEAALGEACRQAGISPKQIQYVEAHGTGTAVGDPIEANALGAVLGQNRLPGDYCFIGAVKSNIGHLESAAGVAGLIKVALSLQHRQIPPNLHFETPNPKIPFEELHLRVPTRLEDWPAHGDTPRLAGVNSFGFGGTNAHIILAEAPNTESTESTDNTEKLPKSYLLPLSARKAEALRDLVQAYVNALAGEKAPLGLESPTLSLPQRERGNQKSLANMCYSASLHRSHHAHRLTLAVQSKAELQEHLQAFLVGETRLGMSSGRVSPNSSTKLAFVFTGMGPQWWAMGRQLLEQESIFRATIQQCDQLMRPLADWSLWDELTADEAHSRINETQIAQPTIFAIQVALTAMWRSWGIEPSAIVGHSIGEVAAACAAGVLSLADGVKVIFHRSRLQQRTAGQGAMLAVGLPPAEAEKLLVGYEDRISLAAINSPSAVTLSGDTATLQQIAQTLEAQEIFNRFLRVEVPYHSPLMEPLKAELIDSLQGINPQFATTPLYSTVTGQAVEGPELQPEYWAQNIRQPVLFAAATQALIQADHDLFLEIGPHPVLASSIQEGLAQAGKTGTVLYSLRRQEPEQVTMLGTLGRLYTLGYPLDWGRLYPQGGQFVRLPAYPWQREQYWQETEESRQDRLGSLDFRSLKGSVNLGQSHPLLGSRLKAVQPTWSVEFNLATLPYLNDHQLQETVIYPAAAYLEMALAVTKQTFGEASTVLENVKFQTAFYPLADKPTTLQFVLDDPSTISTQEAREFKIYGQAKEDWTLFVTGELVPKTVTAEAVDLAEIRLRCTTTRTKQDCYTHLNKVGYSYGPYFQAIEQVWVGTGEALAQLQIQPDVKIDLVNYFVHPIILDAGIHALLATASIEKVYLPIEVEQFTIYSYLNGYANEQLWYYVQFPLLQGDVNNFKGKVLLLDSAGHVLLQLKGLHYQALEQTPFSDSTLLNDLYTYQWELQPRPGQPVVYPPAHDLPSCHHIVAQVQLFSEQLSQQFNRAHYYEQVEPQFEALSLAFIWEALLRLGKQFSLHERFTTVALSQQLAIIPEHHRLFERMLAIMAEDGILKKENETWEVCHIPVLKEAKEMWVALLAQFPGYLAELILTRRCGQALAEVLRGKVDPLQLIFPDSSLTVSEQLYQDSPTFRIYNLLARQAIATMLDQVSPERTLRILEIGGGTGALTAYILPILPIQQTTYIFTDVSHLFTTQAKQKFEAYPFVQYKLLNIELDPDLQGFELHSFDLILASDVLHATADLRQTLENVKQLLTPQGILVMLELTKAPRWFDLVFGLLKGWWLFTDTALRPTQPLLSWQKWASLLQEVGFAESGVIRDLAVGQASCLLSMDRQDACPTEPRESLHSIILARMPGQTSEVLETSEVYTPDSVNGYWLVFVDQQGVGQQLVTLLDNSGERAISVSPGQGYQQFDDTHFQIRPDHLADIQHLLQTSLKTSTILKGVVHLWSLDIAPPAQLTVQSFEVAETIGCLSTALLVQGLAQINWEAGTAPRIWLVTQGVYGIGGLAEPIALAQAPLWGLGRVIMNEHPDLRCTLVDLGLGGSPHPNPPLKGEGEQEYQSETLTSKNKIFALLISNLLAELLADDHEDEIALREESRFVHRLKRVNQISYLTSKIQPQPSTVDPIPYCLELTKPGLVDSLVWRQTTRPAPGQGQVEIAVQAAGLSFKDVAKAMNLPDNSNLSGNFGERFLGLECAGIITAVGAGVTEFKIGDAVVALAPHSFSTYALAEARLVVLKPAQLSFEEAATIPLVFLTAYYSLHYLGRLAQHERILIHAAAGGVGLAAIQLAQRVGANILATTSSLEKREFLWSLGVKQIMDSRSLEFAQEIPRYTHGEGVDLVLNSLGGEAIAKSLTTLGHYGRFIELGKRDIDQNRKLGLLPFQRNLAFFAVDIDQLLRQRPDLAGKLFREIMQLVADKQLQALPHRVFAITDAAKAFQHMARAKHIGKIVLNVGQASCLSADDRQDACPTSTINGESTYLITGGLGGFGLAMAEWLVQRGARHLVLMGRRGASTATAQEILKNLEKAGADVKVIKADVTVEPQVVALLADIQATMPPLRGIIHAAMVLDDTPVFQLNQARLHQVMLPKAMGAWHLHCHTLTLPLDFFILFSSFVSMVGNPGQGNYSAANAFLDRLAHYRHSQGLPALTVNWGSVAGVGYVAQSAEISHHFAQIGIEPLPLAPLWLTLEQLLNQRTVQVTLARMEWTRWLTAHPVGNSPRFRPLVSQGEVEQNQDETIEDPFLIEESHNLQSSIEEWLRQEVATVLRTAPTKIELEQPLRDLGFDSLMTVELRNHLRTNLGIEVPIAKLGGQTSVAQLARDFAERWQSKYIAKTQLPLALR